MPVSQQDRAVEAGRELWKSPNPPAQSRSTLLRSVSSWALSICKNGYPTTSLGNLCQGSTIFTVRKVFPDLQTDFSVFQYVPIASCPVLGLLKRVWLCLLSPNSLTRNLYAWIRSYSAFPSSDWTVPAAFVSSPVQSVLYKPFLPVFYISRLGEGTAGLVILVINEAVKQCQTQYQPLGYTTDDWAPAGVITADHSPLIPAIQPLFNISCSPFV